MKQDVSPGIIAVVAVVLVAIIGFVGFKMFGPKARPQGHPPPPPSGPHVDMKNYTRDNPPPGSGGR
jgi:hypothetical protein